MQYDLGLLLSLFVSLGYVCIRPSPQLHPVRPARRLVSLVVLAPVALSMATKIAGQGIAIGLLKRQSWYCPTENQVLQACAWHAFELYSWHDLSKPKGLRDSAHHFVFSAAVAHAANLMQSDTLFNHCAGTQKHSSADRAHSQRRKATVLPGQVQQASSAYTEDMT